MCLLGCLVAVKVEHYRACKHDMRSALLLCQAQALHMPGRLFGGLEAAQDAWQRSSSMPGSWNYDLLLGGQVLALHMPGG